MVTRTARARYEGMGKDGTGFLSTQSGVLTDQRYGLGSRFGDEPGTNPEELIAAAHASCFAMALSFAIGREGITNGMLDVQAKVELDKDGDSFKVSRSDLTLTADVPGLDESRLRDLADEAKRNCPISKLLNAEISLDVKVGQPA